MRFIINLPSLQEQSSRFRKETIHNDQIKEEKKQMIKSNRSY